MAVVGSAGGVSPGVSRERADPRRWIASIVLMMGCLADI